MDIILDKIKDNATEELKREHIITRQDLHNVKAKYNIDGMIRPKNDLISLLSWWKKCAVWNITRFYC